LRGAAGLRGLGDPIASGGRDTEVSPQREKRAECSGIVGMKNLFKTTFRGGVADIGGLEIPLNGVPEGHRHYVAIRPEDIVVGREVSANQQEKAFPATVTAVFSQGFTYELHVRAGNLTFKALVTKKSLVHLGVREGIDVLISFDPDSVHSL
jgi:molybdate/tungstate transport system ATP-binding protein